MPFDTTNFDYTKVSPVYDRDHPPKRMSEAIRMAVADVEAQERAGIEYEWTGCDACTAGAVCRRVEPDWGHYHGWYREPSKSEGWGNILHALSALTNPYSNLALYEAYNKWPSGFNSNPSIFDDRTYNYSANPYQWSIDMLALADRLSAEGS